MAGKFQEQSSKSLETVVYSCLRTPSVVFTSQSYEMTSWNVKHETKEIIQFMIAFPDISNLKALSETVRKIHDLKKAFLGKSYSGIHIYYPKHRYNDHIY